MTVREERPGRWFFHEVVESTVKEFLSHKDSIRRGCLSCLALSSMADHFFYANGSAQQEHKTSRYFRKALGSSNFAFEQILAVANATKHVRRIERAGERTWVGFSDLSSEEISSFQLRAGWPMWGREVTVEVEPGQIWLLSQLVAVTETCGVIC